MTTGIGTNCNRCDREKILDADGNLHCPEGCMPLIVEITDKSLDLDEQRKERNIQEQKDHTGPYNDGWNDLKLV